MLKHSIVIPIYFHTDESRTHELISGDDIPAEKFEIRDTKFYNIDVVTEERDPVTGALEARVYVSGNSFCSPLSVEEVNKRIFEALAKN